VVVAWSRCSTQTKEQKQALVRQKERVLTYCKENYPGETIAELSCSASGFNLKNPKLLELVRMVCEGKVKVLVVEHADRLNRSIGSLITYLCELHDCEVVVIEKDEDKTDEQQLVEDISSLCLLFSSRRNGARSKAQKAVPAVVVKRAHELVALGRNWQEIQRAIEHEGYRNEDGSPFSAFALRKVVELQTIKLERADNTGVREFMATSSQKQDTYRTLTSDAYEGYCCYAKEHGHDIASKALFFKAVKNPRTMYNLKGKAHNCFMGIVWAGVKNYRVKELNPTTGENTTESFLRYVNENRGWSGNIADFIKEYRAWCKLFNLVDLSKIRIKQTLAQLGIVPTARRIITL
jgi:predicted site-specific integrase-resolvase